MYSNCKLHTRRQTHMEGLIMAQECKQLKIFAGGQAGGRQTRRALSLVAGERVSILESKRKRKDVKIYLLQAAFRSAERCVRQREREREDSPSRAVQVCLLPKSRNVLYACKQRVAERHFDLNKQQNLFRGGGNTNKLQAPFQ